MTPFLPRPNLIKFSQFFKRTTNGFKRTTNGITFVTFVNVTCAIVSLVKISVSIHHHCQ
jgi:hypothetical protein